MPACGGPCRRARIAARPAGWNGCRSPPAQCGLRGGPPVTAPLPRPLGGPPPSTTPRRWPGRPDGKQAGMGPRIQRVRSSERSLYNRTFALLLEDRLGRDPALGQPARHQQFQQMVGVGPIRLGPTLLPPQCRHIGRLGYMGHTAYPGYFLGHIPPPGAALHGELHPAAPLELAQPHPQMLPISRTDPTPGNLPGHNVCVLVGQLATMNVERSYDCHGGPPRVPSYATAAVLRLNRGGPHMPSLTLRSSSTS